MANDPTYDEEHQRRVAASRKRVAGFRKAGIKDKGKLLEEGRLRRNFLFAPPAKDEGLAFVEKYFAKEVEKPHTQLAAITEAWQTCAPDYAKTAQLVSFKRGTLEVAVDSASTQYKLNMDLRTGLEQRLRSAHTGETLKKIKVNLGGGAAKSESGAEKAETDGLRRVQLSKVMKAAEKGEL